jgi:hypothetical protein
VIETVYLSPSSAEVRNGWSCHPDYPYVYYVTELKYSDSLYFTVQSYECALKKLCSYYRYIYTDSIKLSSVEEASGVLYASKKYMLPHLSRLCHNYLLSNLRPSNVLSIFEFAKGIQETELLEPCMEVSQNFVPQNSYMHVVYKNFKRLTTHVQQML